MLKVAETLNIILNVWNNTYAPYSENKTIHQLFEERASIQPHHIALSSTGNSMTYHDLNALSNQVARGLEKYGVEANSFVGILLPRSSELIVSLLSIIKTGAAYVPLNLTDPSVRILKICETANIEFVITTHEFKDIFENTGKRVILLEQLLSDSVNLNVNNLDNYVSSESTAYIIFTSGTTGTPKGVLVKHKPVINLIEWVNTEFKIDYTDKLIWTTNLSFDLSVYDIFGILAAGGTLRILNDQERMNPEEQLNIILKENVTFWDSAPQSLQRIVPLLSEFKEHTLNSSLRHVFLSGDWIPLTLPAEIKTYFNKAQVVGLGGATEATVWSNYFVINQIEPAWKSIPYGKPIQNAKYYILDPNLEHCDILTPGDLYIGGHCLASGYVNDQELTNKKFIDDPYNENSKLYFTGDKAQWMPDGNIEFLGRDDLQVKVRGYRIELGEIKQAVLSFSDVKDCLVVPDKTDIFNAKIFLFFIPDKQTNVDGKKLENELKKVLPDYMVPHGIFAIDNFPMTSNGKIDNKTLLEIAKTKGNKPAEEITRQGLEGIYQKLFILWSDLLGHSNFSANDNFNLIGGDSLFAYRIINKLREQEGYNISFKDLNTNSSIKKLGDFLLSLNKNEIPSTINHKPSITGITLSSQQKRIWLNAVLNPEAVNYNLSFTYRLSGDLNINLFRKSLDFLLKRHPIFFSVLKIVNNEPFFDILPHEIILHNLDSIKEDLEPIINGNSRDRIDIHKDRLYKLFLIKLAENEYVFQFVIHHIIFDGLSLQIFIKDLGTIYNNISGKTNEKLSDITLSQADFAEWEALVYNSDEENNYLQYWKQYLNGVPSVLDFPYDNLRSANSLGFGDRVSFCLGKELSEKITGLSKKAGVSTFATMLSAYSVLMHKYSNNSDFCIGVPVSYRPNSQLDNVIGMFVNTVVLRFSFTEDLTFKQLVEQTGNDTINAISNQNVPFEKIVNALNPDRINYANPLFQISFAWQENMDVPFGIRNIKSSRLSNRGGVSTFDISLYIWENDGVIEGEVEFNIDILNSSTITRFKNNFLHFLDVIVENPDKTINSLQIVSPEEVKVLDEFNNTQVPYPKEKTIVQLFEDQAAIFPDKTAVVYKDETLTYRQLNEKANQLARTLRKAGVSRNEPVGILVDKSTEMVVGILAILKAGGAYLAIDPVFPLQRINFIVKDGGCKVLLTQKHLLEIAVEGVAKFDLNSPKIYNSETSNILSVNSSDDLAYIIYTSGSTGIPKASLIRHFSVLRTVINPNYMDLTSNDKILYTSAIVFDVTTFELWGALLNGVTVFVAEKETILNPSALGKELKEKEITILHLTSALFTQIAEIRTDIFDSLKYLMVGGDVLSSPHINKVRNDIPHLKVLNCYGPSENTTFSTVYLVEKDYEYNIPVGKPINNSTAYVLDKYLNYLPVGVIGELYVGGDGLSKEYLNRDDLNKKSFVKHPFKINERLYKTGDLCKWLPDGNIEFHGRTDNQIKVRGYRVELGEIEAAITELENVVESVIKPIKLNDGNYKLVAFINVNEFSKMNSKDIENKIREKLPPYMVPSLYKFMDGFPKTVNGKIDKEKLVIGSEELREEKYKTGEKLTPLEESLFNIWAEVLKTKNFTIYDNFFEIGGNSLLTILIASKIEKAFNVDFDIRNFFRSPRVKDLAQLIDMKIKIAHSSKMVGGEI